MTDDQLLSIFISSKMTELAEERRALREALAAYHVHGWLWEDDAGARPESIRSTYLAEVDACDIYVGLFWLAYGPYTIDEFERARQQQKQCLIYEKHVAVDQRDPQLKAFLTRIQHVESPEGLTVCRFETSQQLAEQAQKDLFRLLTTTFREKRKQPAHAPTPPAVSITAKKKGIAIHTMYGNVNQYNSSPSDGEDER